MAGKAAVRHNGIKHGITSRDPVIDNIETTQDWERHRSGIVAGIQPEGPLEEDLANRLATILWRLRRVTRYEVAVINLAIAGELEDQRDNEEAALRLQLNIPEPGPKVLREQIEANVLPNESETNKIIKYETHLHRQSLQLLHEIEALQARRRGEPTPLARLDISGPPL